MGYLKEFRADVTERIEALDTQCREDVATLVNFIVNIVLESYRNGEKKTRAAQRDEKRAARAKGGKEEKDAKPSA